MPTRTEPETTFRVALPFVGNVESYKDAAGRERRKIFGRGSVSTDGDGHIVTDHDNDRIDPATLEAATAQAFKDRIEFDADHDGVKRGEFIELAYISPEKAKAMGMAFEVDAPAKNFLWAGAEITDPETIRRIDAKELGELSIEYSAMRHVDSADGAKARPVGWLRELKLHRLSLVKAGAGRGVQVTLCKARERVQGNKMNAEEILKAIAALPPEEKDAILKALAPKADEKPAEDKPPPPPDGKSRPVETEGEKALKAVVAAMQQKHAEMAEQLERETKAREIRESVDEAKALGLEYLPGGTIEEHAEKIRLARKSFPKDQADKFVSTLKSAAEGVKAGALLKNHGVGSHAGQSPSGGAYEQIKAHAKALREKNPQLDETEARLAAAREHPELYAQMRTEQGSRS